ncbi:hypothetical protein GOP47_0012603 [Adiantum capillus-veneris]|uniref:Uncharacterized protein n=1 Tax=Adiantum capillus-veneris TaxID=13818 RepID=A0A9D4URH7_ADICA|nr:hypothetical protein GOP47_0012603 [Adiantum capillus-veneris]
MHYLNGGLSLLIIFLSITEGTATNNLSSHIYESTDFGDYKGMQLCFLGTSSSIPTLRRNTSCLALRLDRVTYLFDCGEGVQKQLYKTPFRFGSIGSIFITHMHGDHVFGLPGVLSGLGMTTNKSERINIYGPEGLRMYIRTILNGCFGRVFSKYAVHELKIGKKPKAGRKRTKEADRHEDEVAGQDFYASSEGIWDIFEDNQYTVKAGLVQHSVPCWGYIVEEKARPGRFSVDRARELGIRPGGNYALLQQGHSITLKDGQKIVPSDVLGHSRRGRKIVILGDTYNSSSLLMAAKGADVLVHECTVLEEEASEAVFRHHSTATMAGKFARAIGTRCLVLTHFGCKFEGRMDHVQRSVKAAQIAFGSKKVIAAKDFLAITVCQTDEPS